MSGSAAEKLKALGIDLADAMDRFDNNVGLYERLALKYLNDGHYTALLAALEVEDFDTAYSEAHGLKGVAGNLSFSDLYQVASFMSKQLFDGEYHSAQAHIPDLDKANANVLQALEEIRDTTILEDAVSEMEAAAVN